MTTRWAILTFLVLALGLPLAACGPGEPTGGAGDGVAEAEAVEAKPIAGRYEVRGNTVEVRSGLKREIAGTIILAEDGDRYTATFDLQTTYPGPDQALPAEVIGKGEGTIRGRTLEGSAETQLVMATVPGVDPGFAFVPRMVSTRIVSTSTATVAADGTVSVSIENQPAPGQEYSATRTTLRGTRVSAAGIGGDEERASP